MDSRRSAADSEKDESAFFAEDYAASVCMVGRSRAFVKTLGMIRLVAASRCNPVLIVGETGTGKELAAKAIHTLRHPDGPFVALNCAALTANSGKIVSQGGRLEDYQVQCNNNSDQQSESLQ